MATNSDGGIVLSVNIDSSEVSSDMKKVVSEINKQVQAEAKNIKAVESVNQAKEKTAQAQQKTEQAVYKTLQAESQALTAEQNLTTAKEKTAQEVAKTETAIYKSLEAEQKAVNAEQALQTEKAKTAQAETQAETAEIRKFQAAVQTVTAIQNQNTAAEKTAQAIEKTKQEQEKTLQTFEKTTQSQQKTIQEQQKVLLNEEKIKQAKEKTAQAEEKTKQAIIKTEKAQHSLEKATNSVTTAIKQMATQLGIAFSLKQMINFSKEAGELASQTEAYLTRMSMLYGESAQDVYDWANANSYALGMAKSTAYEAAAQYGSLFTTFASAQESAKLSIDMLQATAVVASQTGRTYEETFEKIQSGIYGNTRAIDDLGISVRQSSLMQTQAWNTVSQNGAKAWNDLTDAELQQLRVLGIIEQSTAKYGNTVMQTTALTRAQFNAAWTDFKATWGQAINIVLMPILQVVTKILNAATAALNAVLGFFGKEVSLTSDTMQGISNGASGLSDDIDKATGSQKELNKEMKKTLAGFDELQILQDNSSDSGSGGSGGGGSSGNTTANAETTLQDISNFELDNKFYQSLQAIAVLVGTIGGALLAWAITDQLLNNTEQFLNKLARVSGIAMTVAGTILLIKGYCDGWVNGIDWGNYAETLSGLALLLQGISILISPMAAAWVGVGGGVALVVLAIKDMITNGISLQNVLMALTGVAVTILSVLTAMGKLNFATLSGSLFALAGIFATVYGASDAWVNGLDWLNFIAIVGGLVTAFISLKKVLEPIAIQLFPSLYDTIGTVIGGMLAAAAGIVMVVVGMKDLVDNGPSVQNMLLLLGGTAAIAIGMATAGFSVLTTAITAVIALVGSFVIALATEKSAIMSVEEAQENLTEAKEKAKQAEDDYITSVDNAEAALKKLEEAEKATGLSGQELYEQVQQGTLDYKDMTDQQKEVYKAYLDNEQKQKDLKETTEKYTQATKDETLASYENELALAKENDRYDEFKESVVDAFEKGRLSADEARDLIGKSMSEMSDDAQQTFMEDLPNDIKDGLDPKNYESLGKRLKDWFGNLFDGIKNTFKKLKNAITGDSDVKNATSGSKSGGVSTQSLSNIPVPSGVSFQVPALAGGAVIPANHEFLAVLGDQKHGTNIEAPAELIKQMAKEAYQEMGLVNNQQQQIIKEEHYNLNQTELMTIMYKLVKGGERLNGTSLVKQGGI